MKRLLPLAALALTLLPLAGCLTAEERRAQFLARRATLEVTTAQGQPVTLQLVASDDGAARAGVSHARTEDYGSAIEQLRVATDRKPRDDRAWFALGAVYEKTGRINQAYEAYRNAYFLRNDPDYEEAWRRTRSKRGDDGGQQGAAPGTPHGAVDAASASGSF